MYIYISVYTFTHAYSYVCLYNYMCIYTDAHVCVSFYPSIYLVIYRSKHVCICINRYANPKQTPCSIMDPILPILLLLGYWAIVFGNCGGPGISIPSIPISKSPLKEASKGANAASGEAPSQRLLPEARRPGPAGRVVILPTASATYTCIYIHIHVYLHICLHTYVHIYIYV